ncbi:MAG TPA: TldD/PmbA family protein [Synergistaceae bacterium]|jgi:TldD protein|nr:TldD/PmbA family protein [Synergistaceae bacterium]NLL41371.1 TldD/PmbA family protein [Synergistaceae bacterium]HPX03374.1 TldD/PmbA family protein [Synergistaceae bacterium]HQA55192.1 TldD/PmbA family protein [Synergistaceae bacterium]
MTDRAIETMIQRLADAEKKGALHADIFIQAGTAHSAHYEDGRIEELASSNTDGSGARIIVGDRTFYSHSPGTSPSALSRILSEAESSAFGTLFPRTQEDDRIPVLTMEERILPPDIGYMKELDRKIRQGSGYVRQVAFRYHISKRNVLIIRSDGTCAKDSRAYCSFSAMVIAEKDGVLQTASERRSMAIDHKDFWSGSAPEDVASAALKRALLMLDAKPCPAGKMKVLLAGEAGGTVIHEACGHGLEADIVEKDHSVYRGKIGEKVAHESVTMIDDPTIPSLYGSYRFDDEGTPARKNVLIENGILRSYLTDILSAKTAGLPLTGNGRRQSYRNIPVPRMSNTFLAPGASDFGSMLAMTDSGLLVKKMGGGEVNPTTGDFVFYVSEAYIIEKGRVSYPVKGAILTGNGPAVLENITALGSDLCMDPGTCGKSGQSVPVTDGQPSMLIEGMTVGGSEA